MNRAVMIVALCACAMFQAILPSWAAMGQAKPPLLLGAVMYYALSRSNTQGVEAAVLGGLLQDSLGPIPHGYSVLAFASIALLVCHYRERVFSEHWFTHVLMGIGASAWVTLALFLLLKGGGLRTGVGFSFVLSKALGMGMLGLVVFPLVYAVIDKLDRALGNVSRLSGGRAA